MMLWVETVTSHPSSRKGRLAKNSWSCLILPQTGKQLTSSSDHLAANQCVTFWDEVTLFEDMAVNFGSQYLGTTVKPFPKKMDISTASGLGGAADVLRGELLPVPEEGLCLV